MRKSAYTTLALALVIVGLMAAGARVASAQTSDVYWLNYFTNNLPTTAPAAQVKIDNPGLTYGNLCAMIYVFDEDQQMTECCGCSETHNGLRMLSVRNDLTSNPLTGVVSTNGVIKIVSAPYPGLCDAALTYVPTPDLRAWATHIENFVPVNGDLLDYYPISGNEFSAVPLGATELAALQSQCLFLQILGSGHGTCSCGSGD
jgi:hypothetical protein